MCQKNKIKLNGCTVQATLEMDNKKTNIIDDQQKHIVTKKKVTVGYDCNVTVFFVSFVYEFLWFLTAIVICADDSLMHLSLDV